MEKVIVVGAGISGATIARLFAETGKQVTIIDKRENIGGNTFDQVNRNGILVQPYGPHIFHTNFKEVFEFLSRFTEWREYEHKVLARVRKDKLVPVPFNLTSLYELFPKEKADSIKEILISEIGENQKVPIMQLKKHENPEIRKFAEYVYKNIFYIYTLKQWGFKPEHLGEEVMNRVPVYLSNDDRYFTDTYQCMPKDGFTSMIKNILRHPNIKIKLSTDAKKVIQLHENKVYYRGKEFDGILIYTGCADELFDYKFGMLPYRSLKFKFKTLKKSSFQPSAVVNYTTSKKYTRITEFTKFTCSPKFDATVIVKEYSEPYKKDKNIPYYPIPKRKNKELFEKYNELAKSYPNLYLLGRLANYKYINMDVAVKNAFALFDEINNLV